MVVGEFDGVHVGHRRLVAAAAALAERERRPLVAVVLHDTRAATHLDEVESVCRRLLLAGIASARVLSVDSAALDAGPSVVDLIAGELEPAQVVMACLPEHGDSARYPALRPGLAQRRIEVVEVERALGADGAPVSSRSIRALLLDGRAAAAGAALGRAYALAGEVVHGSGLGHTIGFPTANVPPPTARLLPALGAYAGIVRLPGGDQHPAAINVGVRPTVELAGSVLVEAHLLDFDGDLYGARIDVAFHHRLRGERRFGSVDTLIAQLRRDVDDTRRALR